MYIGIDIGGTRIRVTISESLENPLLLTTIEQNTTNNFVTDLQNIEKTIAHITSETIDGIGIGIAGQLEKEMLWEAPNLSDWIKKPITQLLKDAYNCPVSIANDAVVAGYGEEKFGLYRNKDFFYVIWGTGIGGSSITHKQKTTVVKQLAWDSHFPLWEKDCGGKQIALTYKKEPKDLTENGWEEVLEKFKQHLHIFIQQTGATKILFGGGIALHNVQKINLLKQHFSNVDIEVSNLGEQANLLGTFCSLHKKLFS